MAKINLKQLTSTAKSTVAQVSGNLENIAGAAGKGAFSASAGENGVSLNANFNQLLEKSRIGNIVNSPIQELYNSKKVKEPLQFPADLTDEHYMIFSVMNRSREARNLSVKERIIRNIVLPIPSNLQTTYGAQYENADLGALGAVAAGRITAEQATTAGTDIAELISSKVNAAVSAFKAGDNDTQLKSAAITTPAAAAAAGTAGFGAVVGALLYHGWGRG